jgi:hypothetical protein
MGAWKSVGEMGARRKACALGAIHLGHSALVNDDLHRTETERVDTIADDAEPLRREMGLVRIRDGRTGSVFRRNSWS